MVVHCTKDGKLQGSREFAGCGQVLYKIARTC